MSSITVELPPGPSGLIFAAAPPLLKAIDANSPLINDKQHVPLNWFAQTLHVENVEHSCISDTTSLEDALELFKNLPRTLVFRREILVGPPLVTISLPVGKDSGIELQGFPPVVVNVDKTSPLFGRVPIGYVVDRLILPDDELTLETGGFTGTFVNRIMTERSQEERILVLKKVVPKGDTKSSSRPFDLGAFGNQSKWTIRRMFGTDERKSSAVRKGAVKSPD